MPLTASEIALLDRNMQRALDRAAARLGEVPAPSTPATDAMLREELAGLESAVGKTVEEFDDPMDQFREFLRLWQDFIFEDGPHPFWVARRVFLIARRYCPKHILEMNGTDLSILFGVERATESARFNLFFDRLAGAGVRGARGGGAKRQSAREHFAEAAKGNHNRSKLGRKIKRKTP